MHKKIQRILKIIIRMVLILFRVAPVLFSCTIGLRIFQAVLPGIQIYIAKELIDTIAAVITHSATINIDWIYILLAFQGLLMISTTGLRSIADLLMARIRLKSTYHIDHLIADKAMRLPLVMFDQPQYYDQLQRANTGLSQRGLGIVQTSLDIMQSIVTLSTYMVILAQLSWVLAVGLFVLILPILLVNMRIGQWRFWQMIGQTPSIRKANYLFNLLIGREAAKEIRLYGLKDYISGLWVEHYWKNGQEQLQLEQKSFWAKLISEGTSTGVNMIAIGYLIWVAVKGEITLGYYVSLNQVLLSAQGIMGIMALNLSRMHEDALFTGELFDFLNLPEEVAAEQPVIFKAPLTFGIQVKHLTFTYPNNRKPDLEDISFDIKPGQKVAIVGENGAGKSTLVKCMLGLYDLTDGQVLIDKVDIRQYEPKSLRNQISAIFQDFVRYQLTVRENIGFGNIGALQDDQALKAAAAKSGAEQLIDRLPNLYESELGPTFQGGTELSFGQWQKIALSRAFLRDAELLVLDEPTASIDPLSEAEFFQQFSMLSAGKTALLVSHRLGGCRDADLILVLKEGRLVERGSHAELIALNGEYAVMFRAQAQWYGDIV